MGDKVNRLYGYNMEHVHGIIESIEESVSRLQDFPSIIDPDNLSMWVEDRLIREFEGSRKESLGYDECFDKIERELSIHFNTYKYYLLLHKYYSKILSVDKIVQLRETLPEAYGKLSFVDYLKEETKILNWLPEELADKLNANISWVNDFSTTNYEILNELSKSTHESPLLQHYKMKKAILGFAKYDDLLDSIDSKYEVIMNLYRGKEAKL